MGLKLSNMEPRIAQEVLDLEVYGRYPEGLTSKARYTIRRRAEIFKIKGKDAYSINP